MIPVFAMIFTLFCFCILLVMIYFSDILYTRNLIKSRITVSAQCLCVSDQYYEGTKNATKENVVFYTGNPENSMRYEELPDAATKLAGEKAKQTLEELLEENLLKALSYRGIEEYSIVDFTIVNILDGYAYEYDCMESVSSSYAAVNEVSHIDLKVAVRAETGLFGVRTFISGETVTLRNGR